MAEPSRLSIEDAILEARHRPTALWATRGARNAAEAAFGMTGRPPGNVLRPEIELLIAVGGGSLMDAAKIWRARERPGVRLIAIPSIWGSGAEVSPIAVNNEQGKKQFFVGDAYLPDAFVVWPDLAASLPEDLVRAACGDAWTHAYEAFLSPLATDDIRDRVAVLFSQMLAVGIRRDPAWFEMSEFACLAQARSAVGLVHGIAHVLEGHIEEAGAWGHARLCSTFLWPVFELNRERSPKWQELSASLGVESELCAEAARQIFDPADFRAAVPSLIARWPEILRDQCTRTNSTLVRRGDLAHFTNLATS